jgi:hypothetical protein
LPYRQKYGNLTIRTTMQRSILRWELIGIGVIAILGSGLHFAFEWSGDWPPMGVIAAVNESVWEHLKIAFWPALFYALFQYPFFKGSAQNFVIAKATGIYVMPIAIVVLFYSYTAIIGGDILIVDILIFVVAVALGQLTSYRLLTVGRLPSWLDKLGVVMVILLAVAMGVFTFYPPQLPIFRDSLTGAYGILP